MNDWEAMYRELNAIAEELYFERHDILGDGTAPSMAYGRVVKLGRMLKRHSEGNRCWGCDTVLRICDGNICPSCADDAGGIK